MAVIIRDIDKIEKEKRKLEYQKKLNELYLDTVNTLIVVLDTEGNIKKINRYGLELLGYENENVLLGKNWFSEIIVSGETIDELQDVFDSILMGETNEFKFYENEVRTFTGDTRVISWSNSLLLGENNEKLGTVSSGTDITERKKTEKKLADSERLYRNLYENSGVGVGLFTEEGKIISFNMHALDNMGLGNEEEVAGKSFYDLFHGEYEDE